MLFVHVARRGYKLKRLKIDTGFKNYVRMFPLLLQPSSAKDIWYTLKDVLLYIIT